MFVSANFLLSLILFLCSAIRPAAHRFAVKDVSVHMAISHDAVVSADNHSHACDALLPNSAAIDQSLVAIWENRGKHRYFLAEDHQNLPEKTMVVHLSAQEGKTFKRCECAKQFPEAWAEWSGRMLTYLHERLGEAELVAGDFNCDFVNLPGFGSIFHGWKRYPSPFDRVPFTSSKKRSWLQAQLHKAYDLDEGVKDVALWKSGGAFKNVVVQAWYKGRKPASPSFPNDVLPSDHMPLEVTYGNRGSGLFVVWNVLGGAKPNEFEFPGFEQCWKPAQDWYKTHWPRMGEMKEIMSPNLAWIDSSRGMGNRDHSLQKMFQKGPTAFQSTERFVSWDAWYTGTHGALDADWYTANKILVSKDWKNTWGQGDAAWFWTKQVDDPFTEQWKEKCNVFEEQKGAIEAELAKTGFPEVGQAMTIRYGDTEVEKKVQIGHAGMARVAMWLYLFDCVSFTLVQDAVKNAGCTNADIEWYGSLVDNKNQEVEKVIETIRNENAWAQQVHVALLDGAKQLTLNVASIAGLAKLD